MTEQENKAKTTLRIVSWNVAGWSATSNLIRSLYGGKISTFLNNFHGTDIFALQEVKGNGGMKRLRQDPVASGACDSTKSGLSLAGWETFWAHSDLQFKGFNGVAIFAKTGLVLAADPRPLRVPDLDAEGRCMLVVTKSCVVFSVYAPAARGKNRAELRDRFFTAIAEAVKRAKVDYGRPVVLCGDLNATYRPADCHWSWRRFSFEKLKSETIPWPRWFSENVRKDLIKDVQEYIQTQKAEKEKEKQQQKKAVSGENSYPRIPVAVAQTKSTTTVQENDEGDLLLLGEEALLPQKEEENENDQENGEISDDHWWIETFCNSEMTGWKSRKWYPVSQLAFYEESEEVRNVIKHTHCDGPANLVKLLGWRNIHKISPNALRQEDEAHAREFFEGAGLVDSLLEIHPDLHINRGLFTCFNQSRNERYSGVGQRIDYLLVDPCLINTEQKQKRREVKRPQQPNNNNTVCPLMESHVNEQGYYWRRLVDAATTNRLFAPAPTDGGGMSKLDLASCEKSLGSILPRDNEYYENKDDEIDENNNNNNNVVLQAGVLYTAPQLSDHVAVFCDVLVSDFQQTEHVQKQMQLLEETTKSCKYVSAMRSISSFFTVKSASSSANNNFAPQRRDRETGQQSQSQPAKKRTSPVEVIELD